MYMTFRYGLYYCSIIISLVLLLFMATCGPQHEASGKDWRDQAKQMAQRDLIGRDITDGKVLQAMGTVPRHLFVPQNYRSQSYNDNPLPIGQGQTISQPYIVAYMAQELKLSGQEKVLEIGTGSGYGAAILAKLARKVYTIELIPELGRRAARTLKANNFNNVEVRVGDGYQGWPEAAPFDRIILTAAPPKIPQALIAQLKPTGILLGPVGNYYQDIVRLTKNKDGKVTKERLLPVRFVPMVPGE